MPAAASAQATPVGFSAPSVPPSLPMPSNRESTPNTIKAPILARARAPSLRGVSRSRKKSHERRVTRVGYVYSKRPVADAEMIPTAVKYENDWPTYPSAPMPTNGRSTPGLNDQFEAP